MEEYEFISVIEEFEKYNENKFKFYQEQNRLLNYHIVAVHNPKIKKPKQLYKFGWEQDDNIIMSIQEYNEMMMLYGKPEGIEIIN